MKALETLSFGQCGVCGEDYAAQNGKQVSEPQPTSSSEYWLRNKLVSMPWPYREWACEHCGAVTGTIEISIEKLHSLTDGNPDKVKFVAERDAQILAEGNRPARPVNWGFVSKRQVVASAELAPIVGTDPQTQEEAFKKVFSYIHENGLQDKVDKKWVNADAVLARVFGRPRSSVWEMGRLVELHLTKVA